MNVKGSGFMKSLWATIFAGTLLVASAQAGATVITATGDPLLSGATVIDFTEVALNTLDPTIGGASFSGESAATLVQNNGAVSTSPFLGNETDGSFGGNVDITFATGVSAFGMALWAVNSDTTIQAFDSAANLIGTATLLSSGPAVNGFLGLGDLGATIWSARVVTTDYLGIDDFQFVTVPEPGTWALLCAGMDVLRCNRLL